ncbi:MAG: hypothetical protein JNG83_04590 [Opitutaceae bacterium]|nr:hypothetical protein [Opitutaceae bacterium]
MKMGLAVYGFVVVAFFSGCSSSDMAERDDYANPLFESNASKRAARGAEIRKLHPSISEEQLEQQLNREIPLGKNR